MCSGDDDLDREVEDWILARLERGEIEAWCYVEVTARWNGFVGKSGIGACCLDPKEGRLAAEEAADDYGLREQALEDLQEQVQLAAERLEALRAIPPEPVSYDLNKFLERFSDSESDFDLQTEPPK
jgi:hypothetical protein